MAAKSRRKAREGALRALYEIEIGGTWPGDAIEEAANFGELDDLLRSYLGELVWGVQREKAALDAKLAPLLQKYEMGRLAAVDRTILRLSTYELVFVPEVPGPVTINEAIELAKKFSTAESGKFVNGVLGKLLSLEPKPVVAEEEGLESEPAIEPEPVTPDSPEAQEALRVGAWQIRGGGDE